MKAAVLVIDMVKDTLEGKREFPVTPFARAIVPRINEISAWARAHSFPVVFACDAFQKDDFIFQGKMKPHSLRGTVGAEVTGLLQRQDSDVFLPKPRFSAFFKTGLEKSLRSWRVDTVVVCGIATHFCVLTTALDALSHDFRTVILSDACASYSAEVHERTLGLYRDNPLFPLLQISDFSAWCRRFSG